MMLILMTSFIACASSDTFTISSTSVLYLSLSGKVSKPEQSSALVIYLPTNLILGKCWGDLGNCLGFSCWFFLLTVLS